MPVRARALAGALIPGDEGSTRVCITNRFLRLILMYEKEIESPDSM